MAKLNKIKFSESECKKHFSFMCPGCGCAHFIQINTEFKPCWDYNKDLEMPTVSPSIRVMFYDNKLKKDMTCHSFIKNGMIQFLNDCTHKLAGKTVELPEWE